MIPKHINDLVEPRIELETSQTIKNINKEYQIKLSHLAAKNLASSGVALTAIRDISLENYRLISQKILNIYIRVLDETEANVDMKLINAVKDDIKTRLEILLNNINELITKNCSPITNKPETMHINFALSEILTEIYNELDLYHERKKILTQKNKWYKKQYVKEGVIAIISAIIGAIVAKIL